MSKTFLPICVVFAISAGIAGGQPIGGGIKLGAPFTDAFQSISTQSFQASPQHFVVGPYVEVRLPDNLSIEGDALHQALDFTIAGASLNSGSWEFPIVIKHKFLPGPFKPYFEAGVAFSHLSDITGIAVNHNENFGIVAGVGGEIHLLHFKLSPEIRYDGWFFRNFNTSIPGSVTAGVFPEVLQSHRNQLAFLVGFGF